MSVIRGTGLVIRDEVAVARVEAAPALPPTGCYPL